MTLNYRVTGGFFSALSNFGIISGSSGKAKND
jgi:hypothetical protein